MSNTNAVTSFNGTSLEELNEAIGITQFPSDTNWYQTIGGLLIQGGLVEAVGSGATVTVPFNVGYPTQVLGVFVQSKGTGVLGWSVDNVTQAGFDLVNAAIANRDFYWWAIGV